MRANPHATVVGRSGYTVNGTIRQHHLAADEPTPSGGAWKAPLNRTNRQ